ncbi:hypothetical protein GCM10012275_21960 [Longimycelium tulufanense]|uniref:Uncharacterized protein n=1 Tax=Longimycelium tulufanense TaxID=907463 RepID=A0A8J3CD76_9PSEU|nr:hydrogen gas-evolving membrane-bound hydrogenase subunit E [Longimycelium tulufanense]GGM50735.1 hypothetical protein GCM10012275_21960 [Longimycelium tulufanense]
MLFLIAVHLALAAVVPLLVRRLGPRGLLGVALVPAITFGWALTQVPGLERGAIHQETLTWSAGLDLRFDFRLDALALLMLLLVSGVGAAVLAYSAYYLGGDAGRVGALLLVFAGAMAGLVTADHLVTLYVFWELTTVCSFLLIGEQGIKEQSRRAAIQAALVTMLGGLLMLLGFVLLGEAAGTYRLSEILAAPPHGGTVPAAAALILLGAFTKSAQLPFHPWLPAAMVAPTPVSAYLHAAAMVKAGVYLIARLTPGLADVPFWRPVALTVGLLTLIVAAWRALRETDLKKLLAYGTVSELGLLTALFGAATHTAALAGAVMLLAHGLFKATLFLVTGIVDHQAGSRDLRELSGVGQRLPALSAVAVLAAASMAGLPPFLGYLGKEATYEAFWHGDTPDHLVLVALAVGFVLTVAYSARFLWGAFAHKPGVAATKVTLPATGFVLPAGVLGVAGLLFGLWPHASNVLATPYADHYPSPVERYHLALWQGLTPTLVLSALVIVLGLVVYAGLDRITAVRQRLPALPDAERAFERTVRGVNQIAVGATRYTQAGSLPLYLTTILLVVLVGPGTMLLFGTTLASPAPPDLVAVQLPLAVLVLGAALGVLRARNRLSAVLMVGVVGYGVAGLFVVHGAPDLALTQFLVETLTLVVVVLVLRRMPVRFTPLERSWRLRWPRWIAALGVGLFVGTFAVTATAARTVPAVSREYADRSEEAGARNVVNAILVDFRALDTLGEISVLAVTAVGVASLVLVTRLSAIKPRRVRQHAAHNRRTEEDRR